MQTNRVAQKSKPLPNYQKIVSDNENRLIRQIRVSAKLFNIINVKNLRV